VREGREEVVLGPIGAVGLAIEPRVVDGHSRALRYLRAYRFVLVLRSHAPF
jgi:hypothetical protein